MIDDWHEVRWEEKLFATSDNLGRKIMECEIKKLNGWL